MASRFKQVERGRHTAGPPGCRCSGPVPGPAALHVAAPLLGVQATTLRQNRWALGAYCASYCRILTGHHTLEDDAMLPHLRASDPRLAPVVS